MPTHYFTNFSPTVLQSNLGANQSNIIDIQKYLYISTLSRILSSLEKMEQKEFVAALISSESVAQQWITRHPATLQLVKEHLERTSLSLKI